MLGMKKSLLFVLAFCALSSGVAQDTIERAYFRNAAAKNASIAAARYAEEGYYYTKFTTLVYTVDSSRVYADTALFFMKRALMLADTALYHAPPSNPEAINYLKSGREKTTVADTVIREFYPMTDILSHRYFGSQACMHLSNAVMDFFNASLLLKGEDGEGPDYRVLPFSDEIVRLEADEASFQHAENLYQTEIAKFQSTLEELDEADANTDSPARKAKIREWRSDITQQLEQSTSELKNVSYRIEQIRQLLDKKYRDDVANVEPPEHSAHFETDGDAERIEMNPPDIDGLAYKIQLGYYPADVDVDDFHGLFPISGETVRDDLLRIFAGLFFTYSDASEGMRYIRQNAIPNAFVVAFLNGKKISLSRAVEIEKLRGVK